MKLTDIQKEIIYNAIDSLLIKLESINESSSIEKIIQSGYYKRDSNNEKFLFDQNIPVLIDDSLSLKIDGFMKKHDGFREYQASLKVSNGIVDTKNNIEFKVITNTTSCDLLKWKVKNDNSSPQPRGEITDRTTYNNPESTAYIGTHYIECYAIKNNICVAKDRLYVVVRK